MRESVPTTREQSFLSFKKMLLFVRKREIGTDIRALGMLDLDFIVPYTAVIHNPPVRVSYGISQ
jgi:hypothetical protein